MVKLFVSGYPLEMDELELVQLLSPFGEVSTVKIVRDKATCKSKGYAFVEVVNREAADDVIGSLNDTGIGDRQLTVRIVPENNDLLPTNISPGPASVYRKIEKYPGQAKKKRPRKQL
jgi:RNA recognition motif-containing protein